MVKAGLGTQEEATTPYLSGESSFETGAAVIDASRAAPTPIPIHRGAILIAASAGAGSPIYGGTEEATTRRPISPSERSMRPPPPSKNQEA